MTENSFAVKILAEGAKQLFKKGTKEVAKKGAKDKLKKETVKKATKEGSKKTARDKGKEKAVETTLKQKKPLLGKNPRVSKHRTSTDLEGGKATAKSIFRHQTKGEKIPTRDIEKGAKIRQSETGANIRFNKDGSSRVDLPNRGAQPNGETIHFGK